VVHVFFLLYHLFLFSKKIKKLKIVSLYKKTKRKEIKMEYTSLH